MSLSRPYHRPRAIFAALGVAVCAVAAYWMLVTTGLIKSPNRSERIGPFEVAHRTLDAYGHRGTSRTLYYHQATRRQLIARSVGAIRFNPNDPAGALFEQCPNSEGPDCGIHYFDGHRNRRWKVSDDVVINQPVTEPVSWSANKRFVVLAGPFHIQIAQLETQTTIDLTETLALSEGKRFARLGEWSPDSRKITVLVGQYTDPVPPFENIAEDLIILDAQDGSATYIATAEPRGWRAFGYNWRLTPNGYSVYAALGRGLDWNVFRKSSFDLPPRITPQWP
jgi:hypothetical protein